MPRSFVTRNDRLLASLFDQLQPSLSDSSYVLCVASDSCRSGDVEMYVMRDGQLLRRSYHQRRYRLSHDDSPPRVGSRYVDESLLVMR